MKNVNILIENGANVKKALELFGDMETYDATLETFLQEVPGKLERIKACKEIGDMANYAILVHSLKSDARYFGFEVLGELAYDHELKSKANDMYYVTEHFNELMKEANRVVNLVKKYMGVGIVDDNLYKAPKTSHDKAILVVDDSNLIRNFILKILDDSFEVISATDGKEAIDILEDDTKRQNIKAVLLDLNMPNVNGFEVLDYYKNKDLPTQTIINENGLLLHVDVENGQKTGYFLDQKSNRYLLRKIAHGKRVVDCFSHTGGFALNAAMGNASHVVSVDVSKTALDQGYQNAKLNHLEDKIEFVQADVFDYLDELKENEFDIIVLDPPAFTKSRRTVQKAYNGYKRINKQAMKVLKNGGYLITCSCSRFMETANFEKMLREAASEAGVVLKQVSVTQQNADHPILWTMEETSYLKFYIFQII